MKKLILLLLITSCNPVKECNSVKEGDFIYVPQLKDTMVVSYAPYNHNYVYALPMLKNRLSMGKGDGIRIFKSEYMLLYKNEKLISCNIQK